MASKKFSPEKIHEFKEAFALFDKNGDGQITVSELAAVMKSLNQNPSDADIKDMIHDVDTDGNGTVEFDEFLEMMAKTFGDTSPDAEMKAAFEVFDLDHDGFITQEELSKVMDMLGEKLTPEEIKHMVIEADSNGDGKIDFNEFRKVMFKP